MSTKDPIERVAVITGASSGIGEATVRALTAAAYRVGLLARRLNRIEALAGELGEGAVAIEADVTDRDSICAAAERVKEKFGRVDVLVNNAGVMLLGPFSAELSGDYRRMIETNLLGAITTTEVFLEQLVADGGGDLINISSVAGRTPGLVMRSTRRRSGAWAAGRSRCDSSCSLACLTPTRRVAQRDPRAPHRPNWLNTRIPLTKETDSTMTSTTPLLTLNNGVEIPAVGLGVFQTPPDETREAVRAALEAGYRHIDTAAAYGNEREVGEAIHRSGLDRAEVFVETKIWISDYGYDETLHAFEKSAGKLGVEQIDLLILHQALPSAFDRTLEAYRALERLLADGKVRAIGVSNFMVEHLTALLEHAAVVPAVNQIECHPYFAQQPVQDLGAEHGILTQAWSPIGGITFYRDGNHRSTLDDPTIGDIASAHGKTAAQVMLRWGLQHGRSVIPKSTKPSRIAENIDVFDFELTASEIEAIDGLDTGRRGGPEPEAITLEAFGREIPEA